MSNLRIGIVGLPNVGKSTLFNALLKKQVALSANYPFVTIEPNVGVVEVPDPRLQILADLVKAEKIVPALVEFFDIAGLVAGASEGAGLGNKFLSHIREVAVIVQVVREFEDGDITHVLNRVNPKEDKEIIDTELILADLQTLNKQKEPRGVKDTFLQTQWEVVNILIKNLNEGKSARLVELTDDQKEAILPLNLLTMKPVIYLLNTSEDRLSDEAFPDWLVGEQTLRVSAKIESDLASFSEEDAKELLVSYGLEQSGLDRLIKAAYTKLGLISFLTAGVKEVRAWTIPKGIDAQHAAGEIHTDFIKHFIKADVSDYIDFVRVGGWVKARDQGLVRSEGKTYVMKDGDVVEFKVGV